MGSRIRRFRRAYRVSAAGAPGVAGVLRSPGVPHARPSAGAPAGRAPRTPGPAEAGQLWLHPRENHAPVARRVAPESLMTWWMRPGRSRAIKEISPVDSFALRAQGHSPAEPRGCSGSTERSRRERRRRATRQEDPQAPGCTAPLVPPYDQRSGSVRRTESRQSTRVTISRCTGMHHP